eukprot:CAMPEP_0206482574 /NCGR_PEP_ID=MMETSP0324_2-20121206/38948_1 /ASSEMBLY_ACC=CAM_ASM_000836 /TAXON_ID=2866 /ORGANISM="Crypthecodinium cohnii, Strain Seligo" /LENGTH=591 /DNA_ID=CAMNT_0053960533 /DNA_START=140 /DNA_END=1915 /DNA_ORIENTATION=+
MTSTCCSCFQGLTGNKKTEFHRRRSGSWQPNASLIPDQMTNAWASPVPRTQPGNSPQSPGDLDLVLSGMDTDAQLAPIKMKSINNRRSKFEVEQLTMSPGSLPKPLTAHEREQAIRRLEPTATFEMLNEVPDEVLEEASPQAQELRRKLTKGATVVFVSAGYPGKRFIYERAAALGVKSVILDHPDSWSKGLVEEGIIAKFLPVDMSQSSDEVFKEAVRAISELGKDGITGKADGVVTFVELSVPLTSRLAEVLGLPGMSPAAVDAARDKHRTRAALKKAGLPTPANFLIKQCSDLKAAAEAVGFPAVLKPVSGAASLGVKKVLSFEELESSYREVAEELGGLVVSSGALTKATNGIKGVNASSVVDLTVLLEQYLDGPEVDVDIVMSDGEWRYAAVSDNGPTSEPYFQEFWGLCPSLLSKQQQTELKELAINSVKVLGFATGVFHVELKYTSTTGPQLIEVNARLGGGPVRECNRLVWGVDLVEEAIFCALGIPARPYSPPTPNTCIGYTFVNAQKSGKLTSEATAKFEAWRKLPNVLSSVPLAKTGDTVVGVKDGLSTWLCELVVTGKTSEEALKYFLKLENDAAADIE